MADYYTIESVRDQVIQQGVRLGHTSIAGTFPANWQYCPCVLSSKCNKSCCVQLGIFFKNPRLGLAVLEVIYLGEKHGGFVRVENLKLNQLIEKKIINPSALEKISY
jgi:hypothetical protein